MKISNQQDLNKFEPLFYQTLKILIAFDNQRHASSDKSIVDRWIKETEISTQMELLEFVLQSFTVPVLFAFSIAEKIKKWVASATEGHSSFATFRDILGLCCGWEKEGYWDFQLVEKELAEYLNLRHPGFASDENQNLKSCILSLQMIFRSYHRIQKLILPNLKGEKLCDLLLRNKDSEESSELETLESCRLTTLMLEHLGKQFASKPKEQWPNLSEVQNEVVTVGLFWAEKRHPDFLLGTQLYFVRMLTIPRVKLAVTYVTERMAEYCLSQPVSPNLTELHLKFQETLKVLFDAAEKSTSSPELIAILKKKLMELKDTFGFADADISTWSEGLTCLIMTYDHYKAQLKSEHENFITLDEHGQIERKTAGDAIPGPSAALSGEEPECWLVGDSVTAGVGALDSDKDKRCIPRSSELLRARGVRLRVTNYSIPGHTTANGAQLIGPLLKARGIVPRIVVNSLGGNNIFQQEYHSDLAAEIEEDMVQFVKVCQEHQGARGEKIQKIIWALDVPETFGDSGDEWRENFPKIMRNVSMRTREGEPNLEHVFSLRPVLTEEYMYKDHAPEENLHPNVKGHEALAQRNVEKLMEILHSSQKKEDTVEASPAGDKTTVLIRKNQALLLMFQREMRNSTPNSLNNKVENSEAGVRQFRFRKKDTASHGST